MKRMDINHDKLREGCSVAFGYVKRTERAKDAHPFYYEGYSKEWGDYEWTDGEGMVYFESEIAFVKTDKFENK